MGYGFRQKVCIQNCDQTAVDNDMVTTNGL